MDSQLCRQLNLMSLDQLAQYLGEDITTINSFYQEILNDTVFLDAVNTKINQVRTLYPKGICAHEQLDSVDWFAIQRIILYVIIRLYHPVRCLETGVFYGGNSSFILHALHKNGQGELISIDLPGQEVDQKGRHHMVGNSEYIPAGLDIGFLIPDYLKDRWTLVRGDSHQEIPRLQGSFDFYMHDSEHSYEFLKKEMSLVWDKLTPNAVVMADDLDWSNGFFSVCDERHLYPLIITDNGKNGLRARTGIIKRDHPFHHRTDVVGR